MDYMKKLFILVLLIMACSLSVSGYGIPQRDQYVYNYVQIRIVNLSGMPVDFYFNSLYRANTHLDMGQEQVTSYTPITDDYPGFIAIKRGNNDLEIYTTSYAGEINGQFFYIILVYRDRIDFYRVRDIDDDYLDLIEKREPVSYSWRKWELSENNISIEIHNNTGEAITIVPYGDFNQRIITDEWRESSGYLRLESGAKSLFTINNEIFLLKKIKFVILYPNTPYQPSFQINYGPPTDTIILDNRQRQGNITIILNGRDIGYEIRY